MSRRTVLLRWIELFAIFALIPLAFLVVLLNYPAAHFALIPILWVSSLLLLYLLSGENGWSHRDLFHLPQTGEALRRVLKRFLFVSAVMMLLAYICVPEHFFKLPRRHPWLMVATGIAYPVLSVLPQGIIYRVFMTRRYLALFKSETAFMVFAAACFAGGHIIFRNWVAVAVTFAGGLIFMRTYQHTKSHLLASLEHALYGVFAFATGIGHYLRLAGG